MSELIIINGEEEFLKEKAVDDEISGRLIQDVSRYDDIDQYIDDISTPSLFGAVKAFVITNCKKIPPLPYGSDVLIVVSGKKKLEDKRATIVYDFPTLKTYSNNNEVVKWIIKEGNKLNIDLSRVATALFINSGKSLRKLYSEMKKLAVVTPPGTAVTPEIAKSLLCFSAELTPKDVIESICEGNTIKALAYHDKLQKYADETGWILAYMQRHVMQFLKMELYLKNGAAKDDLAGIMDVHPYMFKQAYEPRLGLWTIDSLKSSLQTLCDLDIANKRGLESATFGLEAEIIRLSEEVKHVRQRSNGKN